MVCSFFLLTVNLANVYMGAAMLNVSSREKNASIHL